MKYRLIESQLTARNIPLLSDVPETITLAADATGTGVFLRAGGGKGPCWSVPVGKIAGLERFTACSRGDSPFWMEPCAGNAMDAVPPETQWLLARLDGGAFLLMVPLMDGMLRFCLAGRDGCLYLQADSGDPAIEQKSGLAAYLALGDDPYALIDSAAAAVCQRLNLGTLRRDKPLPDFIDWFGWCTWNAFYREVSEADVRRGLESFRKTGVPPKFLILDDGWQSTQTQPDGAIRLSGFDANEKFPGGLAPLVTEAKHRFGIEHFLVWHAVMGYWGGVDAAALPDYAVQLMPRRSPPTFARDMVERTAWMGRDCGVVPPQRIEAFYDDYHRRLADQGVDGVKIDNQASLEFTSAGLGGRVGMTLAFRRAMEKSCRRHFKGRLINCMSNANEMHLMARDSNLTRTSTDFWPDLPESHGLHLYTNAQVGLWFGQFVHPDWDMFESGHPMGAYHAAARALSGGPVYVADPPDRIDADLLRKLVCADGAILRCRDVALPSPESLFHNPTREPVLLKIFNHNAHGAVVGAFHAQTGKSTADPLSGTVGPRDVPGWQADRTAVWAHQSQSLSVLAPAETIPVRLEAGEWELYTLAPWVDGVAVIGLADKFNSGGAVSDLVHEANRLSFTMRDGGRLILAVARAPAEVNFENKKLDVTYDGRSGILWSTVPAAGRITVTWVCMI